MRLEIPRDDCLDNNRKHLLQDLQVLHRSTARDQSLFHLAYMDIAKDYSMQGLGRLMELSGATIILRL